MDKEMKLQNLGMWYATGSKENKKLFLSLLIRNGFGAFDGMKTAKKVLYPGAIIKHVEVNRKGEIGNFFISTSEKDDNLMHFDLDRLDVFWALTYIMQPKK